MTFVFCAKKPKEETQSPPHHIANMSISKPAYPYQALLSLNESGAMKFIFFHPK